MDAIPVFCLRFATLFPRNFGTTEYKLRGGSTLVAGLGSRITPRLLHY